MLLEFGLKNYFSFKEGVTVSFRLDANCPSEVSRGQNFTHVLCIKGANASGKTNILKGIYFLARFATSSFDFHPESLIPLDGFFDSKGPSEFYAEFKVDDKIFRYELEATENEVIRETFYRTQAKKTMLIERRKEELTHCVSSLKALKTIKIRRNASIISTAKQYGINDLDTFDNFFKSIFGNISFNGEHRKLKIEEAAKHISAKKEMLSFIKSFINQCDSGVSDIKIAEYRRENGDTIYSPHFIHTADGKDHVVTRFTESSGTQALFIDLINYKNTLDTGGVLVLDEFDIYLHPHILPKLIQLFLEPAFNPQNAQLIFSTHNSEILNDLGRYRSYLVNKVDNESFAYRLDEIPGDILRNDRPILPAYNDGKIGGVPKL